MTYARAGGRGVVSTGRSLGALFLSPPPPSLSLSAGGCKVECGTKTYTGHFIGFGLGGQRARWMVLEVRMDLTEGRRRNGRRGRTGRRWGVRGGGDRRRRPVLSSGLGRGSLEGCFIAGEGCKATTDFGPILQCLLIPSYLHRDCPACPACPSPSLPLLVLDWGAAKAGVDAEYVHLIPPIHHPWRQLPLHHYCVINHGRVSSRCGRWWRRGRHGSRVSAPARTLPTEPVVTSHKYQHRVLGTSSQPNPHHHVFLFPFPSHPRQDRCGNNASGFLGCLLIASSLLAHGRLSIGVSWCLPSGRWALPLQHQATSRVFTQAGNPPHAYTLPRLSENCARFLANRRQSLSVCGS